MVALASHAFLPRPAATILLQHHGLAAALQAPAMAALPGWAAPPRWQLVQAALLRHSSSAAAWPRASSTGPSAVHAGDPAAAASIGGGEGSPRHEFQRWLDSMEAQGCKVEFDAEQGSILVEGQEGQLRLWTAPEQTPPLGRRVRWAAGTVASVAACYYLFIAFLLPGT